MWLRLRQICLVARELKPVEEQLNKVLGINVCFRDPGVGFFGLENALYILSDCFTKAEFTLDNIGFMSFGKTLVSLKN